MGRRAALTREGLLSRLAILAQPSAREYVESGEVGAISKNVQLFPSVGGCVDDAVGRESPRKCAQ
jgi:hypothetical protein